MFSNKLLITALVLTGTLGFGCSTNDMGSASRSAGRSSDQSAAGSQTASASQTGSASQQKSAGKISNADMRKVEEALKAKGYDPGPINGEMDAQTRQAVRDFQKKNNMADTGIVDQATADALGVVIIIAAE
jgi:peptidoglycan hydrolase-like protein with peptidoglycan-binding domain